MTSSKLRMSTCARTEPVTSAMVTLGITSDFQPACPVDGSQPSWKEKN